MQTGGTRASLAVDARYILSELLNGPRSYWELLRTSRRHAAAVIADLRELLRSGLVAYAAPHFRLTPEGRALAQREGLRARRDVTCPTCRGRSVTLDGELGAALERFRELTRRRPRALAWYDQGPVTAEVSVLRVAYMAARGDLDGRELSFLGDDDLTCIATALSGRPRRIQVAEADERLVGFIADVARSQGWQGYLTVQRYDVREELPAALRGRFDVFFTDPVETLEGILLFLSRGTEALRERGVGYFGLGDLEASAGKWQKIQRGVLEMGYAITEILPRFHEYALEQVLESDWQVVTEAPVPVSEPDVLFYTSSLVRVQLVAPPQPLYTGPVPMGRELYYDDEAYATGPAAPEP